MPEAVILLPSLPKLVDYREDVWQSLWRGAIAEFFATLIFVFIGTGAVVATNTLYGESVNTTPNLVSPLTLIAIAHGFAIMVLIYAIGEISGGHINPAVTWAVVITGKISITRAVVYVFSQLFGAIVGSSLLKSLLPPALQGGMGCHELNPLITPAQGFGAEFIFTFIFLFVVFATAISPFAGKMSPLSGGSKEFGPGKLTPFAVGMAILMLHCVGIPITGASMNPARTFGPAVVNSCWKNHWVYWVGPIGGSTTAAFISQIIFLSTPRDLFRLNNTPQVLRQTPPDPPVETDLTIVTGTEHDIPVQIPLDDLPLDSPEPKPKPKPQQIKIQLTPKVQTPPPEPQKGTEEIHNMHKSASGQSFAIMQEEMVELD